MGTISDGLYQLFFKLNVVTLAENENAVAVFVIACSIVGSLAVSLDLAFFILKERSLLSLKHSPKNTFLFLLAWSFGAFVMGLVGQMFNIFQVSLAATVVVGFSWPILLTGMLEKLKEKEQIAEPEQQVTAEE
jgi:hypothetical protein